MLLIIWSYQYKVEHVGKKSDSLLRPIFLFISFRFSLSLSLDISSSLPNYELICVTGDAIFCFCFLLPNDTNGEISCILLLYDKIFLAV